MPCHCNNRRAPGRGILCGGRAPSRRRDAPARRAVANFPQFADFLAVFSQIGHFPRDIGTRGPLLDSREGVGGRDHAQIALPREWPVLQWTVAARGRQPRRADASPPRTQRRLHGRAGSKLAPAPRGRGGLRCRGRARDVGRRGVQAHGAALLDLRRRRRRRLSAQPRDPAHQGADRRPLGAAAVAAHRHQARGARGPPPARAHVSRPRTAGAGRADGLARARPGGDGQRPRARAAHGGGARHAEAERAPVPGAEGARLLLRRDLRAHRIQLDQGEPVADRGAPAVLRVLRRDLDRRSLRALSAAAVGGLRRSCRATRTSAPCALTWRRARRAGLRCAPTARRPHASPSWCRPRSCCPCSSGRACGRASSIGCPAAAASAPVRWARSSSRARRWSAPRRRPRWWPPPRRWRAAAWPCRSRCGHCRSASRPRAWSNRRSRCSAPAPSRRSRPAGQPAPPRRRRRRSRGPRSRPEQTAAEHDRGRVRPRALDGRSAARGVATPSRTRSSRPRASAPPAAGSAAATVRCRRRGVRAMSALRSHARWRAWRSACPGPRQAGIYEVRACGSVAGAAQNAFVAVADSMMSAYSICPSVERRRHRHRDQGDVERRSRAVRRRRVPDVHCSARARSSSTSPSTSARSGSTSDWSVGHRRVRRRLGRGRLSVRLLPVELLLRRRHAGLLDRRRTVNLFSHARFRFQTRCVNPAGCDLSASPFNPANRGAVLGRERRSCACGTSIPPALTAVRTARCGTADGIADARRRGPNYTDGSGIMVSRLYVDGIARQTQDYRDGSWPDWVRCDFTRPRPCVDIAPGGLDLDTATLADGEHRIDVEAIDAAGNAARVGHTIRVDNTIPAKPEGVAVGGGEGWRSANRFDLALGEPARAGRADRAGPLPAVPGQRRRLHRRRRRRTTTSRARACAFPSRASGRCACGSRTPPATTTPAGRATAVRAALRRRGAAPRCSRQQDARRPAHRARARGRRRLGRRGRDGRAAPPRDRGRGSTPAAGLRGSRLEARIDDLALAGRHLRAARPRARRGRQRAHRHAPRGRLADEAGAAAARGRRRRARPRALPLRGAAALPARAAASATARRCTARLTRERRAGAGRHRDGAVPAAHRRRVRARSPRCAPTPTAASRSSAGSGPSRTLRFRWARDRHGAAGAADMRVARAGALLDRGRPPPCAERRARSRSAAGCSGGPLPDGGKLVDLQVKLRGRWRTFAAPRADSAGRWSYAYRFEATRGLVALQLPRADQARGGLSVRARALPRRARDRRGLRAPIGARRGPGYGTPDPIRNDVARDHQAAPARAGHAPPRGPQGPEPLSEPGPERVPDAEGAEDRARVAPRRGRARGARRRPPARPEGWS